MTGVRFGTKHSYDDFGLILSKKEITLPDPKTETVNVFGRDGLLDLSEGLTDDIKFKNRKLTFTFTVPNGLTYWTSALSSISNYLHGRKMQIILDADKTFYYYGRCTIDQFKSDKRLATIVVVCDVEPYKIEVNGAGMPWMWDTFSFVNGIIHVNTVTLKNNESVTLNLINLKKKVSPTVTTTGKIKFTFNDFSETFTGKKTLVDVRLTEGGNNVTITCLDANGASVNIAYKGGSL